MTTDATPDDLTKLTNKELLSLSQRTWLGRTYGAAPGDIDNEVKRRLALEAIPPDAAGADEDRFIARLQGSASDEEFTDALKDAAAGFKPAPIPDAIWLTNEAMQEIEHEITSQPRLSVYHELALAIARAASEKAVAYIRETEVAKLQGELESATQDRDDNWTS